MQRINGTRDDLIRALKKADARTGAEIGVADGKFSLALCRAIEGLALYCIDPWCTYGGNRRGGSDLAHARRYTLARERLSPYHAMLMRMTSREAAPLITNASLDFVFIDGNHDYAYVREDIALWSDKVKRGGIIAGHDYYAFRNSGVIEAVNEYASERALDVKVIGTMQKHRDDNANPCWYWAQP